MRITYISTLDDAFYYLNQAANAQGNGLPITGTAIEQPDGKRLSISERYGLDFLTLFYSIPSGFGRHCLLAVHPSVAVSIRSNRGIYGFISSNGVMFNTSMPLTTKIFLSLVISFTIDIPIPLGLHGCLVANIPWGSSSKKVGLISSVSPDLSN